MKFITTIKQGIAVLIIFLSLINTSFAADISIGRYLSVAEKPMASQENLIKQQIQISFPADVITLNDAMQFTLRFTGYHLTSQFSPAVNAMLQQPLPLVDKTLGSITLGEALTTLAGEPFILLIDPVHREIGFQLKLSYSELYTNGG